MNVMEHLLPSIGTELGDFKLIEPLGRGGFGAVYKAFQGKLHREVAVKVLLGKASHASQELAQRFLREIDLVRRLEHPNIVRLYDYGQTDEGLLWMAMELVRGDALNQVLKEQVVEPERCRRITLQILSALVEAHEHNIVHRDLKPSNIMLTRKGAEKNWVKLLDFGIGKALNSADSLAVQDLTATDQGGYGTPRYMAPEQIRNQELGPHTDLYAVGLILFEMLVGRPAVSGETTFEILANQITADIELPDWLEPTPVGKIIRRAIEKDWRKRYANAIDFYEALDAITLHDLVVPKKDHGLSFVEHTSPSGEISMVSSKLPDPSQVSMDPSATPSAQHSLNSLPEPSVPISQSSTSMVSDPEPSVPIGGDFPPRRSNVLVIGVVVAFLAMAGVIVFLLGQEPAKDDNANAASQETTPQAPETQPPPKEEEPAKPDLRVVMRQAVGFASPVVYRAFKDADRDTEIAGLKAEKLASSVKTKTKTKTKRKSSSKKREKSKPAKVGMATVTIETTPSKAQISYGSKKCSKSPCTFEVSMSKKEIKVSVKASGYHSSTVKVKVGKSKVKKKVTLTRAL